MSFSHLRLLMGFHWSRIDCKSPPVPKNLLSILANLNNAVVWMVLILPASCLFLWGPFLAHQLSLISLSPTCFPVCLFFFFFVFSQSQSICLSFRFLLFSLCSSEICLTSCSFFFFYQ